MIINPQHYATNLADIRIWIGIDPEIRIRIPDHIFSLTESVVYECSYYVSEHVETCCHDWAYKTEEVFNFW